MFARTRARMHAGARGRGNRCIRAGAHTYARTRSRAQARVGNPGRANRLLGTQAGCRAYRWSYGATVSTLDPDSSDCGSNPRRTFLLGAQHHGALSWENGG